ncbi:hypothetical protein ILUMI_26775 [Ignelater luminosus]|uniref:Uncharacterized protein n=1 Tax=Ignelater luminosus TaxID=2038154 RepID=A0A8K0FX89_IGNLU|nr:hypothetical protein ILUMI_26775 [Ignelater luminosus]
MSTSFDRTLHLRQQHEIVAAAARLENTYLPPASAFGAGGSGSFLGTPFRASSAHKFGGSAFGSGSFKSGGAFPGVPAAAASGAYHATSYSSGPHVGIVRYDNDNDGLGHYAYAYETQNHISAQESGELKNAGSANEANSVHGSYSYTGPDGVAITVNYVADENGFQPSGAHLPTPPPIPEAILKSLQFNAANPSSEYDSGNDGQYQAQYQAPSFNRQYVAPAKPSFSPQSGYRY